MMPNFSAIDDPTGYNENLPSTEYLIDVFKGDNNVFLMSIYSSLTFVPIDVFLV